MKDLKLRRIQHHMTVDQIDRLKAISSRTGLSVAELVRRAVELLLDQEERKARKKEGNR